MQPLPKGTRLYLKRGFNSFNVRTGPAASFEAKTIADAKGKLLGRLIESKGDASGNLWHRLDYSGKFVWVLAANCEAEFVAGETVYKKPGAKVEFLTALTGGQKVKAPADELGVVQAIRQAGPQSLMLEVRFSGNLFFVPYESAVGIKAAVDQMNELARSDRKVYAGALLCQKLLNQKKAGGADFSAAQGKLDAIMQGYARRQATMEAIAAKDEAETDRSLTGSLKELYDEVKGGLSGVPGCGCHGGDGVGALPVWVVVVAVALIVAGVAALSIATYKWIFKERPLKASEFDQKKLEKFRACLQKAKSGQEVNSCYDGLKQDIDDHGQKAFEDGEESKDKGWFDGVFDGLKYVAMAAGTLVLYNIVRDERKGGRLR